MINLLTKKCNKNMGLEKEINEVILTLSTLEKDSEEYQTTLKILERLINVNDKINKSKSEKLNKDTIAVVLGNLLGILLILNFERTEVIRTKALGLLMKGRV